MAVGDGKHLITTIVCSIMTGHLKKGIRAHRSSNLVVGDGVLAISDLSLTHHLKVSSVVGIRNRVKESPSDHVTEAETSDETREHAGSKSSTTDETSGDLLVVEHAVVLDDNGLTIDNIAISLEGARVVDDHAQRVRKNCGPM